MFDFPLTPEDQDFLNSQYTAEYKTHRKHTVDYEECVARPISSIEEQCFSILRTQNSKQQVCGLPVWKTTKKKKKVKLLLQRHHMKNTSVSSEI